MDVFAEYAEGRITRFGIVIVATLVLTSCSTTGPSRPTAASASKSATLEAQSSGDLGYEIGSYVLTANSPNGEAVTERGRYIELLNSGADGKWYSTAGIWNAAPQ